MGASRQAGINALLALLLIVPSGCDQGLSPEDSTSGPGYVSGTIHYRNWPDSLRDLRLVLFRQFPPASIVSEVLEGTAVVYPPLGDTSLVPFFVDSLPYALAAEPGVYDYVVVAEQFGPNVFRDWRPVGQYDLDTNRTIPSPITVTRGDTLRGIDINVDFLDPPPSPFR